MMLVERSEWGEAYVLPTGEDCDRVAWIIATIGPVKFTFYWATVRDLMLAGF